MLNFTIYIIEIILAAAIIISLTISFRTIYLIALEIIAEIKAYFASKKTTPEPTTPLAIPSYKPFCAPARRLARRRQRRVTASDIAKAKAEIRNEVARFDSVDKALKTLKRANPAISDRIMRHLEQTFKHQPACKAAEHNVYHPANQSPRALRIRKAIALEICAAA